MNTPLKEIATTGPSSVKFLKHKGLCTAQDIASLNNVEFERLIHNETHQLRHALRNVKLNADQIVPRLVPEAVAVRIEDVKYEEIEENYTVLKSSSSDFTFVEEEILNASLLYKGNKKNE